eukprot:UN03970
MCLSDFIAPKNEYNVVDYIGLFVVSSGFGIDDLCADYRLNKTDDYSALLAQALADRLGEAFAEKMHFDVRREYWGYEESNFDDKCVDVSDLHKIKYQGIRPAPGYPSQPDPSELEIIWELLSVEEKLNIKLTKHYAMHPAATVSGLYIHHKESKYFQLGQITKQQIAHYHERKRPNDKNIQNTQKWLKSYLSYDVDK